MINETEKHPAQLLFEIVIQELQRVVRTEIANMNRPANRKEKPPQRKHYSVKETAWQLNCSEVTVHRLINRGLLRTNKATRHIKISCKQIEQFVGDTM